MLLIAGIGIFMVHTVWLTYWLCSPLSICRIQYDSVNKQWCFIQKNNKKLEFQNLDCGCNLHVVSFVLQQGVLKKRRIAIFRDQIINHQELRLAIREFVR